MADTTRNRAAVCAQFLRAAVLDIQRTQNRNDPVSRERRELALGAIEGVAQELEDGAKDPNAQQSTPAPDPAGKGS